MSTATKRLRELLKRDGLLYMPSVYDPFGGRMVQQVGFDAAYVGGFVTGASRAVSEPLLTLTEQVETASAVARSIPLPVIADAGAAFGEPLHATRTVREFINGGIAGVHIEDQLYPKRAHYHKYVAHAIPEAEFGDKIRWACKERDKLDPDFVIIARTDTCRFEGLDVAIRRMEIGAAEGADMGLLFPTDDETARAAPKRSPIPLIYVQSRGNRDGRPVYSLQEMEDMGYAACIDAQLFLLAAVNGARQALREMKQSGVYSGFSTEQNVELRQYVEDTIGLDEYYAIEEATVENKG
ncbi:MAG: isocitrate lyase/PEP mutase family protein [Proteobacteria bacterium]|nr:isocitrate lyase/PEP mutase family protein [Pseudomonadota bacterium]